MSKVKVFRFTSGLVSPVDVDLVTDTINKWVEDNGVELVNGSTTTTGNGAVLFASVIYDVADASRG